MGLECEVLRNFDALTDKFKETLINSSDTKAIIVAEKNATSKPKLLFSSIA